jgi:hypothetical protein
LLLESAQALDEAQASNSPAVATAPGAAETGAAPESPLAPLTRFNGVEFVLTVSPDSEKFECWGVENPEKLAAWIRQRLQQFRAMGESLGAGPLNQLDCVGPQNHLAIVSKGSAGLCVGFHASLSQALVRETMPKIVEKWAS